MPRNLSREQGGRLKNCNNILRDSWHSAEQCSEPWASAMRTTRLIQKKRQVKRPLSWKAQGNVGLFQPHRCRCRLVCPRVGDDLPLERDGKKTESGWMRIPSTGKTKESQTWRLVMEIPETKQLGRGAEREARQMCQPLPSCRGSGDPPWGRHSGRF